MERKFNITKEMAMDYNYCARMEEIFGRHVKLPKKLKIACEQITQGLCDGVILLGKAGTGRISYAKLMARELKAPVYQLSFTAGTRLDDFYRSRTFSEPIEKGGILIIEGMEFCHESVKWWLKNWFLHTHAGQKLDKPKLDDRLNIPVYTMSPNFVLILVLDLDYLRQGLSGISIAWGLRYPAYTVCDDGPNLIEIRKMYREAK